MKISTVQEMRKLDMEAMSAYGLSGEILMENAGQAVYHAILRETGVRGRRFLVLAGPGHNGGDGFVVARKLHSTGGQVRVLILADSGSYSGPSRRNLERLAKGGVDLRFHPEAREVDDALKWCDWVVDGLLGTGISRDVKGAFKEVIGQVGRWEKPVFSIDIPSGVDGDTGEVRGAAIRAKLTVTFGLPKLGNLLSPGKDAGGRLLVSHISFPPKLLADASIPVFLNEPGPLPPRLSSSPSEGAGSQVLFLLGQEGASHEADPAPRAFLEVGGRRAPAVWPCSNAKSPGGVTHTRPDATQGEEASPHPGIQDLMEMGRRARAIVVARRFRSSPSVFRLARSFAMDLSTPLILGGNAGELLGRDRDILRARKGPTVILLGVEEAALVTGHSSQELRTRGPGLLAVWAAEMGAILGLLGPPSFLSFPRRLSYLSVHDTPLGEIAGAGDVLAGTAAALCQMGLELEDALRTGFFLVGLAGKKALEEGWGNDPGEALLRHLAWAADSLRDLPGDLPEDFFGALEVI